MRSHVSNFERTSASARRSGKRQTTSRTTTLKFTSAIAMPRTRSSPQFPLHVKRTIPHMHFAYMRIHKGRSIALRDVWPTLYRCDPLCRRIGLLNLPASRKDDICHLRGHERVGASRKSEGTSCDAGSLDDKACPSPPPSPLTLFANNFSGNRINTFLLNMNVRTIL